MSMSRKDYVAIAKAINDARAEVSSNEPQCTYEIAKKAAINIAAYNLAKVFAADNPKFDSHKFLSAVGLA